MTREEAKRRAELYSALADGKTIQWKHPTKGEWLSVWHKIGIVMTMAEYTRLVAQIAVLKEIAMAYPTKTIEDIIMQMESRKKEIGNIATKQ